MKKEEGRRKRGKERGVGKGEEGERTLSVFLYLVAFSLAGSLLSRLTHLDPGPIAPITSLLTLGAGVVATFGDYVRIAPHAYSRLLAALVLGAGAEVVGLATGFPFGRYVYTGTWWPTVRLPFGPFPLALPFAWLLMAGTSRLSLKGRASPRASVSEALVWSVAGGLLATVVDLAMEPVMAGSLGYWRWLTVGPLPGGAPIANFFGWWATATLAGFVLTLGAAAVRPRRPRRVLAIFIVLILGLGLIGRL